MRERERSCGLEVTSAAAALLSNDSAVSLNASRRRFKTVGMKTSHGFHIMEKVDIAINGGSQCIRAIYLYSILGECGIFLSDVLADK